MAMTVATVAFAQSAAPAEEAPKSPSGTPELTLEAAVLGVQSFYKDVSDYKADFEQVVTRKHLPRPLKKRGTVFFKRPGMMRWDYTQPEKVYYISDSDVLWTYQPEDKLVYKLSVKDSELYGSLKFLFGQGDLVGEFQVSLEGVASDIITLRLVPRVKQTNYKELTLFLRRSNYEIVATELVDPLDNRSRITFSKATYEPLKEAGFKFKPPKGVRVEALKGAR